MNNKMLVTIAKFAKKAGYKGEVTEDNAQEIVKALAENYTDSLANQLEKGYALAVRFYGMYESNETKHFEENYHLISDNLDAILLLLDIKTDYPGLYPSFELDRNGKHFTEYSTLGALRQYNNFWNHW